jgi:hypothetical protein
LLVLVLVLRAGWALSRPGWLWGASGMALLTAVRACCTRKSTCWACGLTKVWLRGCGCLALLALIALLAVVAGLGLRLGLMRRGCGASWRGGRALDQSIGDGTGHLGRQFGPARQCVCVCEREREREKTKSPNRSFRACVETSKRTITHRVA